MKCNKCGNDLFKIEEFKCDNCKHNGAWDPDKQKYIYDDKIIDSKRLDRDQCLVDFNCELGSNHNLGCYMFVCDNCRAATIIDCMED